jgi:hypothetical protein
MARSLTLKKKHRCLQLTHRLPREKLLFCPIDVSKHVHRAFFHDMDCQPRSEFFTFSASHQGFEVFLHHLQAILPYPNPQLVLIGMEPPAVYDENLLYHLCAHWSSSENPRFARGMVDPGAVANHRMPHS